MRWPAHVDQLHGAGRVPAPAPRYRPAPHIPFFSLFFPFFLALCSTFNTHYPKAVSLPLIGNTHLCPSHHPLSPPPYLAGAFNLTQLTGGRRPAGAGPAGDQASLKLAAVTANGVTAVANTIYAGQACAGNPLVPPMVDMTQGSRETGASPRGSGGA